MLTVVLLGDQASGGEACKERRTGLHLVITVAALWFREFRHRFHPIFIELCRFALCELKKVSWRSNWRKSLKEMTLTRKHRNQKNPS